MKKVLSLFLICAMLTGCGAQPGGTNPDSTPEIIVTTKPADTVKEISGHIVDIRLDGQDLTVSGEAEGVYTSRDIIYYEQKTRYESGYPYGEGGEADMHTAEEAASHLVVNITAPGSYRLSGRLDLGQIRIDLGEEACTDPEAVVNLILDGLEITCEVGPAILFCNVYECDGNWSVDTAKPDVDTAAAGANLILAENSRNIVNGSYVAKIYQDKEGEKKLWKQDGAIYSYMSMNVYGPGSLELYAENEGLDTELHLTIFGGDITIRSGNDGINTNEDGVSVTTIRGGDLRIIAGLGEEGDGIDSNGYLVIYGGTVVAAANPAADAGLDSNLGSFVHGGTVLALGSAMDWAESDSGQVTMNLQFAKHQDALSAIVVAKEDGSVVFAYDPARDEVLGENARTYQGAILSCPDFALNDSYEVFIGSTVTGEETGGIYDAATATGFSGGAQMAYTGTDVVMRPGGFGDFGGGQRPEGGIGLPEDRDPDNMPQPPEGDVQIPPQPGEGRDPVPQGDRPEDWTMPSMPAGEMPTWPEGEMPARPEGQEPPGGFDNSGGEFNTLFFMQDKVNFFTGLTETQPE